METPVLLRRVGIWALALVAMTSAALSSVPSRAATTAPLLYEYSFAGTNGTVANLAPDGRALPLTLKGSWSTVSGGVHFTGDTVGHHAIAVGVPASGYTLNAPATESVGFGAEIVYNAPASGRCFADTPNITQIGRFADYQAQAKLQLSKCADNSKAVVMECRFAGAKTPSSVLPVISRLALINKDKYAVTCKKGADTESGNATVTLAVTNLSVAGGATAVTKSFTVGALGAMRTNEALSAGNKYPLPSPSKNTDQFVGDIDRLVFCTGTSAAVSSCLAQQL